MAHDVKCADTVSILTEWNETITVKRATVAYDGTGLSTQTWTSVGTFVGDWQPVSGSAMRSEAGLSARSEAIIIGPCDLDVQENDQIVLADGTIYYVNYVRAYEDHTTIYLKRTGGQN